MRFPLAGLPALAVAALGAASPAFAQTASVRDIEVSRDGEKVSILVQFSHQPASADAKGSADGLTLDIDGIDLFKLQLDPPPGSLVTHVEAGGKRVSLSGAAFSSASTVIYRNAVLVEARLAEPPLRGASLMPASASATAAIVAPQPKAPEPKAREPKPAAAHPTAPAQTAPEPKPEMKAAEHSNPLESRPVALPSQAPATTAPVAKADLTVSTGSLTALAGIGAARCIGALEDLAGDPWSVAALGDHALCLLDQGKSKEAANRLDQLAAFAPEDWRISLGRAALAAEKGDASNAEINYRAAAMLAPDETVRAAIATRITKPAAH